MSFVALFLSQIVFDLKRKVVFLLFPHFHLMDFAGPAQVFYEAGGLGKVQYDVRYAAATEKVMSEQQIKVCDLTPYTSLNLKPGDFICVPGIDFSRFVNHEFDALIKSLAGWMKEQKDHGVYIGSICSGALILGRMGLLNGLECSTHWKCAEYFKTQFPSARLQLNQLYSFDQGVFTSAGMTAGIDMSLALIERWSNPLIAAKIAQEMVINVRRPQAKEQKNVFLDFENHFNPDVYKAQEILLNRLETTYTVQDLADEMNMSKRHLLRLFKHHTGKTIQKFRDEARVDLGTKLLLHSEKSVKEIAIECGFQNARQYARLWQKEKGGTPMQFRSAQAISS